MSHTEEEVWLGFERSLYTSCNDKLERTLTKIAVAVSWVCFLDVPVCLHSSA